MKLYKGGGKAYSFISIITVCILWAFHPIGAAESSIDPPSTREAPDSASDSIANTSTLAEAASDGAGVSYSAGENSEEAASPAESSEASASAASSGASGSGGSAGSGVSSSVIDTLEFTGAAMARVPIVVPPGRSGIQPNLNLTYNSYQKNSWLGVGWGLDVGSIQRSSKYGVDYSTNDFVAVKEGSFSELVERGDWGSGFYGAKIEGGYARYRYNGEDGWEVTAKDGTRYYYGTTAASRQDDPADGSRVFKWCLDRVQDPNGNYMTVAYVKDQGQIYLDEIVYTGNGNLDPANAVRFYLEERDDAPAVYTPYFA
ncbi:MAG: hypothetical protein KJP23_27010, partial [Deltaproteobacteria bacterium]|nr:hypothetical protein [Deltaproteobacteria bacterium]